MIHGGTNGKHLCFDGEAKIICKVEENILYDGEIQNNKKCIDGHMMLPCSVEGEILVHADRKIMDDGHLRICEDGVMKPKKCK